MIPGPVVQTLLSRIQSFLCPSLPLGKRSSAGPHLPVTAELCPQIHTLGPGPSTSRCDSTWSQAFTEMLKFHEANPL